MVNLYNRYLKLKKQNKNKMYLFPCGKFYIFLDEDCETINKYMVLKPTLYNKRIYKCGFPNNKLDEYIERFKNINLDVEIIKNDVIDYTALVKYIQSINMNDVTPMDAFNHLVKIKELINE